jgi:hypothetical protein
MKGRLFIIIINNNYIQREKGKRGKKKGEREREREREGNK